LSFNRDGYVDLGNPPEFRTNEGTVEAWVKIPSDGGGVCLHVGMSVMIIVI